MRLHVLTGDDSLKIRSRRAELLTASGVTPAGVEGFDLSADGGSALAAAASAMSLFASERFLHASPADALSANSAGQIAAAAPISDVIMVIHGTKALPADAKKALAGVAELETHSVPSHAGHLAARVSELAADAGITLNSDTRAAMTDRAGHDLPRVAGVLAQCSLIGLTHPNLAQVNMLLGTSAAPGVPWALTDAVENGDIATALTVADGLEPVAVVSYFASRCGQLGRVVDDNITSGDEAASAFGIAHRFPATKLVTLAQRLGRRGVAQTWDIIAAADRDVKVAKDPRAVLDLLVLTLADLWGRGVRPAARAS